MRGSTHSQCFMECQARSGAACRAMSTNSSGLKLYRMRCSLKTCHSTTVYDTYTHGPRPVVWPWHSCPMRAHGIHAYHTMPQGSRALLHAVPPHGNAHSRSNLSAPVPCVLDQGGLRFYPGISASHMYMHLECGTSFIGATRAGAGRSVVVIFQTCARDTHCCDMLLTCTWTWHMGLPRT